VRIKGSWGTLCQGGGRDSAFLIWVDKEQLRADKGTCVVGGATGGGRNKSERRGVILPGLLNGEDAEVKIKACPLTSWKRRKGSCGKVRRGYFLVGENH